MSDGVANDFSCNSEQGITTEDRKCQNDIVLPDNNDHYDTYCENEVEWIRNEIVLLDTVENMNCRKKLCLYAQLCNISKFFHKNNIVNMVFNPRYANIRTYVHFVQP